MTVELSELEIRLIADLYAAAARESMTPISRYYCPDDPDEKKAFMAFMGLLKKLNIEVVSADQYLLDTEQYMKAAL